jgi:cytochrome P450
MTDAFATLFTDETRRDPYPAYEHLRSRAPVFNDPATGLWVALDYDSVKRVLNDHELFSSRLGPAFWMIFLDPPNHTKLRALISQAFTPNSIANLEPRIVRLCRLLLEPLLEREEIDLVADFSALLPMMVISEMMGLPAADGPQFWRWNEVILNMSYTIPGGANARGATDAFHAATAEMNAYLGDLLAERRAQPRSDLLTRLLQAEVDGERLSQQDILGFFQLLLLAATETTTNLISNAILCFIDNPEQLEKVRALPGLLPSAIEEVLRYRSPLQWMFRVVRRDVELHGHTVPAGKVILAMIGAANRDPKQFAEPNRFDVARDPNPHIAFGHGVHFCLGAALARMEARIALQYWLQNVEQLELAGSKSWEPRKGLHVHGPVKLPLKFRARRELANHLAHNG